MRRSITLFVCQLILWTLVSQLNHTISGLHVHLFIGALFVTYAALTQPLGSGLAATLLTGLVFDANTPVGFGTHMVLFAFTHVSIFGLRDRVPRNETLSRVVVAVLANLALFLVFAMTQMVNLPSTAPVWPRLLIELVCSQVLVALIAPWFFALQTRALVIARVEYASFA